MIEVELRAFITKEQYYALQQLFERSGQYDGVDEQVTYYFDAPGDLRLQQNLKGTKLWLKKGSMHDEAREEINIRCSHDSFEELEKLFLALGYSVKMKWYRKRHRYHWRGVDACVDHTKGYGYILELEQRCTANVQQQVIEQLRMMFKELGVGLTPREEFEKQFVYYQEHWKELTA